MPSLGAMVALGGYLARRLGSVSVRPLKPKGTSMRVSAPWRAPSAPDRGNLLNMIEAGDVTTADEVALLTKGASGAEYFVFLRPRSAVAAVAVFVGLEDFRREDMPAVDLLLSQILGRAFLDLKLCTLELQGAKAGALKVFAGLGVLEDANTEVRCVVSKQHYDALRA